jgi:hypothetical protein
MPAGPQEHDILALKKGTGYSIVRFVRGDFEPIEGAADRDRAETRAKQLAAEDQADAWVEEISGVYRSLET